MSNASKPKVRKPKKSNKLLLLLLLIVVAATVVLVASTRKADSASAGSGTYTVERRDLTVTVTEAGSITAHKSVAYDCEVERRGMGGGGGGSSASITILNIVPQGTIVTQQDVDDELILCELDSSSLEDNLLQEKMSLTSDEQNVVEAREAYDIQVIDNDSSIASGELRARFSLMDLQKYLGKNLANRMVEDVSVEDSNETINLTEYLAPFVEEVRNDPNILAGSSAGQSLKQLQDNIVLAEGNLKTQQQTLAGTERLYDANFVSDLELEQDRLSLKNRRFSLETAQINLDLFLDYDFPKNAEQYLSNYIEDFRNLARIYAQCRSRVAQASARLSSAEERYTDQLDQVQLLERQIASCIIRAKSTGMVVYGTGSTRDTYRMMRGRGGGNTGSSSGTIAEGETVSPGQTIISIPDTSTWIAEISVHETEVDKVRAGQAALITMDAFPDQTLTGVVTEIAPLPDQSQSMMNPDLKVYATKVQIEGSHDFLKTRMSCKVEMLVNRVRDAIVVPVTVVASSAGNKFCYVMTPEGAQQKRDVKTGVFNDIYVEVTEGLQVGEKVLLNPPVETDMIEIDLFEGVEAIPTINGNGSTGGGMQGMMQDYGEGMGGRGGEGMGGRGGEGMGGRGGEGMGGRGGGTGGRGGGGTGGRGGGTGDFGGR
ncbi:efflux RND transporter periplasmic adaptor subunit [Planctomycetota bacterium]